MLHGRSPVGDTLLKIVVPPLPGKALKRQMPFRQDDGIFEENFIEERKKGLEQFINKLVFSHITYRGLRARR